MKQVLITALSLLLTPTIGIAEELSPKPTNPALPLALPESVNIVLKNGQSISDAQLTHIDTSNQKITITKSSETTTLNFPQVAQISLRGKVILSDISTLVFQGDNIEKACGQLKNLQEPLTNFKFVPPRRAEILMTNTDSKTRRAMVSVSQDSTYVVEEMAFETTNESPQIFLKMKPCRPR